MVLCSRVVPGLLFWLQSYRAHLRDTRQEAGKLFGRLFLAKDALEILNYGREEQLERKERFKETRLWIG